MSNDTKYKFDEVVLDYEQARPNYPNELINDIIALSNIDISSNILEVGCGTGQATKAFVEKGYGLTAIELGSELAKFTIKKLKDYSNLIVYNQCFEDWKGEDNSFDLMISATAFHWINSEIGYPKVHKLLKANGSIAVFWNMASVTHHNNYAFEKVREVYREYAPELGDGKTKEELEQIHELRLKELLGQGLFTELVYKSYVKEVEYTPEKYVQLLNTYSNHRMLSEEKRTIFFEKIKETIYNSGGKIIIPNETKLYFAKKIV